MKLSWRDLMIVMFMIAIAVIMFAKLRNYDWEFISTWKSAVAALGGAGVLMVLYDETDFTKMDYWTAAEGLLVIAGATLTISGLLVASKAIFITLGITLLAFGLTSITRHMFSHETRLTHTAA